MAAEVNGPDEVDVGALPRAHRLAVDGEVVLHPRPDPRVAPGAERRGDRGRVGAAIEQVQQPAICMLAMATPRPAVGAVVATESPTATRPGRPSWGR